MIVLIVGHGAREHALARRRLTEWLRREAQARPVLRLARETGLTEGAVRALLLEKS